MRYSVRYEAEELDSTGRDQRYEAGELNYAGGILRYEAGKLRYAGGDLRYEARELRYGAGELKSPGGCVRSHGEIISPSRIAVKITWLELQ